MGLKYLLLIGAIAVVAWLLHNARHRRLDHDRSQAGTGGTRAAARMVRCVHCGLHVPENEAVRRGDDAFCSREHAELGRDNH